MNNNTQDQNEAVINSLLETIASRNKEISALTVSLSAEQTYNGGQMKSLCAEIERLKELVSIKSDLAASYIEQTVVLEGEVGRLEWDIQGKNIVIDALKIDLSTK